MYTFKKTKRLLNKTEYDYVFDKANKLVTTDFIVLFRGNELGYARLGLAISKKKIAKSHERNRIKRLLREGFRQAQLPAIDMIVMARSGLAKKENFAINSKLDKTWEKLTSY